MARRQHRIRVHGQARKEPDVRRLSKVVIELARAQAEAEAQAEHAKRHHRRPKQARPDERAKPEETGQ
jgi:hypothetical protein